MPLEISHWNTFGQTGSYARRPVGTAETLTLTAGYAQATAGQDADSVSIVANGENARIRIGTAGPAEHLILNGERLWLQGGVRIDAKLG